MSNENTTCYTYKVEMIIQVLAQNENQASEKLDVEGGFVSKRETTLLDYTPLPNGAVENE